MNENKKSEQAVKDAERFVKLGIQLSQADKNLLKFLAKK